jgi:hypothetical protein
MKYNYSELSYTQFEHVVTHICYKLFGIGTSTFADGRDGGRDARFDAIANIYPSERKPWSGLTIIQAKHTSGFNKKFSDDDFFNNKTSQINKEIPKICTLIQEDSLQNYILFSNRKLSANYNEDILNHISINTGLDKENIALIGIDQIEELLKAFPQIVDATDLHPFDMPLNIDPDELAEVILAINSGISALNTNDLDMTINRVAFNEKNKINNLGESYANTILDQIESLAVIREYLSMPENDEALTRYRESAAELKAKISIYIRDLDKFDFVIDFVIDLLISRDSDCKKHRFLTRIVIYYMYYNCDIGANHVATA